MYSPVGLTQSPTAAGGGGSGEGLEDEGGGGEGEKERWLAAAEERRKQEDITREVCARADTSARTPRAHTLTRTHKPQKYSRIQTRTATWITCSESDSEGRWTAGTVKLLYGRAERGVVSFFAKRDWGPMGQAIRAMERVVGQRLDHLAGPHAHAHAHARTRTRVRASARARTHKHTPRRHADTLESTPARQPRSHARMQRQPDASQKE